MLVIYSDSKYLIWNFASELFFFRCCPSQFFVPLNAHGYRYKDRGWFARTIHFVEFMKSNESFHFGYETIQHRCRMIWFKISDFFFLRLLFVSLLPANISISFFVRTIGSWHIHANKHSRIQQNVQKRRKWMKRLKTCADVDFIDKTRLQYYYLRVFLCLWRQVVA